MKLTKGTLLGAFLIGGLFATAGPASADVWHGHYYNRRADVRNDRRELFRDRRELRHDWRNDASRAEISRDRRELWRDRFDLRHDRYDHRSWWHW